MSFSGFLILLLIAALCGGIGQNIAGYKFGGCLVSAGVGFLGAIIGKWIATNLGLPELWSVTIDGEAFPIIWSILGGALFSGVLGAIAKNKDKKKS
jgi:uncharacterized membrane protein YeaQ/YmgE (transglycosylase-associated protein family)